MLGQHDSMPRAAESRAYAWAQGICETSGHQALTLGKQVLGTHRSKTHVPATWRLSRSLGGLGAQPSGVLGGDRRDVGAPDLDSREAGPRRRLVSEAHEPAPVREARPSMLWATTPGIREGKVETDLGLGVRVPCEVPWKPAHLRDPGRTRGGKSETILPGCATCGRGPWSLRPVHSMG